MHNEVSRTVERKAYRHHRSLLTSSAPLDIFLSTFKNKFGLQGSFHFLRTQQTVG
ncbi:hypothetical protein Mapa_015284 [Marchantia paleacea]|nr:hypothetical protein Mapa_015284 [Marchantia paleacea]